MLVLLLITNNKGLTHRNFVSQLYSHATVRQKESSRCSRQLRRLITYYTNQESLRKSYLIIHINMNLSINKGKKWMSEHTSSLYVSWVEEYVPQKVFPMFKNGFHIYLMRRSHKLAFRATCKIGQPIEAIRQHFFASSWSAVKKDIMEILFHAYFCNLLIKKTWKKTVKYWKDFLRYWSTL